jgi:hypothetical protein
MEGRTMTAETTYTGPDLDGAEVLASVQRPGVPLPLYMATVGADVEKPRPRVHPPRQDSEDAAPIPFPFRGPHE